MTDLLLCVTLGFILGLLFSDAYDLYLTRKYSL